MLNVDKFNDHKRKRIKWLDFAKGVTILFVVIAHLMANVIPFFPSFVHFFNYITFIFVMPVFFAISGYLYRPTNNLKKYDILLYKKCASFIIPYIIFTFIIIFCENIHHFINHLFLNGFKIFYLPFGYLWFLYVLFFIFLIVGIMDVFHINFYFQFIISIILLLISCRMSWDFTYHNNGQNLYPFIRICGYMSCFYIGILLKKFDIVSFLKNKWRMSYLFVIWVIVIGIQHHISNSFDTNSFGFVDLISKLLSIFVCFSFFANFKRNNWIFKYFDKYGKYTLLIYVTHLPLIWLTGDFISKTSVMNRNIYIGFPIKFIICWFGSIMICHLALKYKSIDFVYYPRKYINKIVIKTKWGNNLLG